MAQKTVLQLVEEYTSVSQDEIPKDDSNAAPISTELIDEMRAFNLCHGNLFKSDTDPVTEPHKAHTAFTTVAPTPFSRKAYEKALDIQPVFNKLYYKISQDYDFLKETLESVVAQDEFVKRFWEIYERSRTSPFTQTDVFLGLTRSDYMCHKDVETIKQVEYNTMSAAASSINRVATQWHRYLCSALLGVDHSRLPENNATNRLAEGLYTAWKLYGVKEAAVMIFKGEPEFNFADQHLLQYELQSINYAMKIIRCEFHHLEKHMRIDDQGRMFVGTTEVAVIYMRYGYSPSQYTSETMWRIRTEMDLSRAIMCPNISFFLSNFKRVQQVLTRPNILARWLTAAEASQISDTFVRILSLNPYEGAEKSKAAALESPDDWVLKPQREGGGNNLYGEDILKAMTSLAPEELARFTLMERIRPVPCYNYLAFLNNPAQRTEVVSELGIFGAYVVHRGEVKLNTSSGYLFRSKPSDRNEGDLKRGTSALDSPWFV